MGETLNLLFCSREDGTYELEVKESWSGHAVSGSFVPPYTPRQLTALLRKLNTLEIDDQELHDIGHRLFLALCGSETPGANRRESSEQSVQAMLRSVIQRTLKRRGTVALTLVFAPGCDELVRYLNSVGGASAFDDQDTTIPCYALHFDGHGAFGRLCPSEACDELNDANARTCKECDASLSRVKPQTYLCFCDEEGRSRLIGTESLRDLLMSSDVRLAVFSACETATLMEERPHHQQRKAAVDATLATALVTAQVPAVVAMPFSLQDDLTPTFTSHFYEALASGRTLEEALSRARQALLPIKQHSWFVPVLYRQVGEGQEGPVAFLATRDEPEEHDHPLAHLGASTVFVGREQELRALSELLTEAVQGEEQHGTAGNTRKLRPGVHHL